MFAIITTTDDFQKRSFQTKTVKIQRNSSIITEFSTHYFYEHSDLLCKSSTFFRMHVAKTAQC